MIQVSKSNIKNEKLNSSELNESWIQLTSPGNFGFTQLPLELDKLKESFSNLSTPDSYSSINVVGLGGSYLGCKAIYDSLDKTNTTKKINFWSSISSEVFKETMKQTDLKDSLLIVISKSGKTSETLAIANQYISHLKNSMTDWNKMVICITDPGENPLRIFANRNNIQCLEHPHNVGGRFSVLSLVGMLPLHLCGFSIEKILAGAAKSLENQEHVTEFTSEIINLWKSSYSKIYLWSYSSKLESFSLWLQQLWAESLGRNKLTSKLNGQLPSFPVCLSGTGSQHSVLQYILEDPSSSAIFFSEKDSKNNENEKHNFFSQLPFLEVSLEGLNDACLHGTIRSFNDSKVPSFHWSFSKLNEESIGEVIMFFELFIGYCGQLLEFDPYNQPAVEKGKSYTRDFLANS